MRCVLRSSRPVLVLALVALALSGCATRTPQRRPPAPAPPTSRPPVTPAPGVQALRVEVGARGSGVVQRVPLEDYVRDVVVGELSVAPADGVLAQPAYEAQAIVARTYALAARGRHRADGFDLCSSTHCQVYARGTWQRSRWAAEIERAVATTRGRFLARDGRPIEAVFHAHCGGHTSTASEVWRSAGAPYLRGIRDPYCLREQPAGWTTTLTLEAVRAAVSGRPRTDVGSRLDGIQVLRRDAGGRVVEIVLAGDRTPVVTGEDFRLAVMAAAGARSLRSAHFDVRRDGADVVFTGRGSGHGVGLCQIGLIGRLRAGQSPEDVLRAYYTGVRIEQVGRGWGTST